MIFYRALDTEGRLHLCPNQAEAKKINKDFDEFDCPTDKPGLMGVLQDLINRAQDAAQGVVQAPSEPAEAPEVGFHVEPAPEHLREALTAALEPGPPLKVRCPKCSMTKQGAQRIADMRVNQLFADELVDLPAESIVRASEILTARLLEVARSTGTMLKP